MAFYKRAAAALALDGRTPVQCDGKRAASEQAA